MENNSDKLLRDKLNGTEFPFDPQAWEQMEAMLDKKKKRRGFFWWWLSGVAAVSLLAVSALVFKQTTDNGQQTTANTVTVGSKQLAVGKKGELEIKNQKSENVTVADGSSVEEQNTSMQLALNNSEKSEVKKAGAGNSKLNKVKTKSQKLKANTRRNSSTALFSAHLSDLPNSKQGKRHQRANVFSKENKQLAVGNKQLHNNRKQQATNKNSTTRNLQPATGIQQEMEMLNSASAKANAEEEISLSRREASLLEYVSENAITSFDKKEEDALPKKKKKIFNYSLGVLANVTGTTLGSQTFSDNPRNRPLLFYKTPSYMVGLTHDFLFINRVAITNSILFSQTSFKVYNPKSVSFTKAPLRYSSQLTELTIPIGIKVYPVVKNNFRLYINTGIINHIKLRETFDYTMSSDTSYNAIANIADMPTIPDQTNFSGVYTPSSLRTPGNETSTKDFSINSAKRYYASFYAGAGFEYVAKKHFIVFTEPMFYMSLQKIGVQEKRKYNFGLSAGFRYQF